MARSGLDVAIAGGQRPLSVPSAAETLVATIPTWRRDLAIEADLAEEVARIHGYDRIEGILPHTRMPPYRRSPLRLRDLVRETLAGAGLTEIVTPALVSPLMVERFAGVDDTEIEGEGRAGGRPVSVTNPLSSQHSVLRQNLLGSALEVVSMNLRQGRPDVALFEVGKGYGATPDGDPTHEWWRLCIALTGPAAFARWDQPERVYDLDDGKGLVELLARRLGQPSPTYEPLTDDPRFHPGRTARMRAGDAIAGRLGEIHPALLEAIEVRTTRVIVAELAIAGLSGGAPDAPLVWTPPRQPAVARDLAVVVAETRPAGDVAASIRRHGGPWLRSLHLFDIYRGHPLAPDEKSLAYRMTFQSEERTLTDTDMDDAMAAVRAGLDNDVNGRVRT
ncbi:MAG: hypothetical protein H0U58_01220 [Chloroflexi bacterium]|nr:hypothetical protein [Chloroflexota bacterium]